MKARAPVDWTGIREIHERSQSPSTDRKPIEITIYELGAILSELDKDQLRLFSKRRSANKADKPAIDAALKTLGARIRQLDAIFDVWTGRS